MITAPTAGELSMACIFVAFPRAIDDHLCQKREFRANITFSNTKIVVGICILRPGRMCGCLKKPNLTCLSSTPFGGGRRIDFPKGDHRRRPCFVIRRIRARLFGFIDFDYFGDIERLGLVLGGL